MLLKNGDIPHEGFIEQINVLLNPIYTGEKLHGTVKNGTGAAFFWHGTGKFYGVNGSGQFIFWHSCLFFNRAETF